ncbi:MAG: hypothetical protein AB8G05_01530 [Oligoflexales bacterium]
MSPPSNNVEYILEEDAVRGLILEIFEKEFQFSGVHNDLQISAAADRLVTEIFKIRGGKGLKERIDLNIDSILKGKMYVYTQACAIACLWETHLRFFADRVGVNPFKPNSEKNSKNKRGKFTEQRDLSVVIEDIKKKFPRIEQRFKAISELRSALIHANMHQLRGKIDASLPPKNREKHKGNVVAIELSTGIQRNLSDNLEIPENESMYGWFLENLNSDLLFTTIEILESSLKDISHLTQIKALSFGEAEGSFSRLFQGAGKVEEEHPKIDSSAKKGQTWVPSIADLRDLQRS